MQEMTPQEALNLLYSSADNWEALKTAVNQASVAVNLSRINEHKEIMKLNDINSSFIDDR